MSHDQSPPQNESAATTSLSIPCPQCGKPSDSIKCYRTGVVTFIVVAVAARTRNHVGCPSCIRKTLLGYGALNVVTANLIWPIVILPITFYGEPEDLRPRYDRLLASRYLLAVRFADYVAPEPGDRGLVAGSARVEAFRIDLKTGDRLASVARPVSQGGFVWVYRSTPLEAAKKQLAENVSRAARKGIGDIVGTKLDAKDRRLAGKVNNSPAR